MDSPIRSSEKVDTLLPALAAFQAALKPIPKEARNPHFGSKYADLPSIMEEIAPLLYKHGLLLTSWMVDGGPGRAALAVRLWHVVSGQWLECVAGCGLARDDAQGAGAANTYLRRYALCALGVITEADDDGNTASGPVYGQRAPERSNRGNGQRAPQRATQGPNSGRPKAPTAADDIEF